MRCSWHRLRGQILLVDADVEAGLLELLFYVNLALLHEGEKIAAEPRDLGERQSVFGDVDGLTGEVRRRRVPLCWGGITVDVHQMLLEFNRAHRRVDL
jgi:hypothetical protein